MYDEDVITVPRVIAAANVSAFVTGFTNQMFIYLSPGPPSPPTMKDQAECRSTWRESELGVKSGRRGRTQKRTARERKDGTWKREKPQNWINFRRYPHIPDPAERQPVGRPEGCADHEWQLVGRSERDFPGEEGGREGVP